MALSDEVTSRYPAVRLAQLTNPGDPTGTGSVDTTVLGLAATDVEADFEFEGGVNYDNTNARHVAIAVEGVIAKLEIRTENPGSKAVADHDRYIERLRQLRRVLPKTKSTLSREAELEGERVDFDRRDFDGLVGDVPVSQSNPRER